MYHYHGYHSLVKSDVNVTMVTIPRLIFIDAGFSELHLVAADLKKRSHTLKVILRPEV